MSGIVACAGDHLTEDSWSASLPRLPSPKQPETSPMPADDGLRLHQDELGSPILTEAPQHDPEQPVPRPEAGSLDTPPEDGKLLAEARFSRASAARPRTEPRRIRAKARTRDIHTSRWNSQVWWK